MTIKKQDPIIIEQLALKLDLPEPEESLGLSQDEVQRISMAAMQVFEAGIASRPADGGRGWIGDYLDLKAAGYEWRLAAYMAWESSPKRDRWPATLQGLATEVLGLKSPRVIYIWRKRNPEIDTVISMMQSAPLYAHRRDVIEALIEVAKNPDYKGHQDRELFFKMIGDYTPRQNVNLNDGRAVKDDDLSGISDEDLRRRAEALRDSDAPEPPQTQAAEDE